MTRTVPLFIVRDDRRSVIRTGALDLNDAAATQRTADQSLLIRWPTRGSPPGLGGLYMHPAWTLKPPPQLRAPSAGLGGDPTPRNPDDLTLAERDDHAPDLRSEAERRLDDALYHHGYDVDSTAGDPLHVKRRLLDLCATFDGVHFADEGTNYACWYHVSDIVPLDLPLAEAVRLVWWRAGCSADVTQALNAYEDFTPLI